MEPTTSAQYRDGRSDRLSQAVGHGIAQTSLNRVLVVDDDPAIRRVVCALLDLDEYGLLEADDGLSALEVVKVERPDLVILDLTMPRLDGLRACQALRSDPELAGTRVLVLTGRDQPHDRAAARDAGADGYLVKPFSSLALLDAVRALTTSAQYRDGRSDRLPRTVGHGIAQTSLTDG
jgi:DNA-binding response OmpR family regulator